MTTKQIAEVAGVTPETVRAKGKELFPTRFENGKKTVFNQKEATAIMSELRKKGFIQPTENLEVATRAKDRLDRLEGLVEKLLGIVAVLLPAKMAEDPKRTALPAPAPLQYRDELRKVVARAGDESGDFRGAWQTLYQEVYYRLHRNFRECAKHRGLDTLDYIEEEGLLPDVLAIAREIFR
jgi:hypothetical protein